MTALPRFIAVEGAIGVGKTTLCKRLAEHFGADTMLEAPSENPFLPRFYQNPKRYAFKTQLTFLVQRVEQIKRMIKADGLILSDYMLAKEQIFAKLTLDKEELALYDTFYEALTAQLPKPDLVVYLQAPVDVLIQRIQHRARDYEQTMDVDYLRHLHEQYSKFFHDYHDSSLIIINNTAINIVQNEADFVQLADFIAQNPKGRHFLNPLSYA